MSNLEDYKEMVKDFDGTPASKPERNITEAQFVYFLAGHLTARAAKTWEKEFHIALSNPGEVYKHFVHQEDDLNTNIGYLINFRKSLSKPKWQDVAKHFSDKEKQIYSFLRTWDHSTQTVVERAYLNTQFTTGLVWGGFDS